MGNSLNKYGTYTKLDTNKKNEIDKIINNIQKYKNKKYLFFNRYQKREDSNDDIYVINKDTELKKIKQNETIFSKLTQNDLKTIEKHNQLVKCNLTGKSYRRKDNYIYILENRNSVKLDNKINILECLKKLEKKGIYYFELEFANFKGGDYNSDVEVKDIKLNDKRKRIFIEGESDKDDFYKKFKEDIKKGSFSKRYTYSFLLKYLELLMNNKMNSSQFIELMKEYYIINKTYEIEYYTSWFNNLSKRENISNYIEKFFIDFINNKNNKFEDIETILCFYLVFIQQCNTHLTMILLDNKVKTFINNNTKLYIKNIPIFKQYIKMKIPAVLQDKKYLSYFQVGESPNFLICPRGDKNLMLEKIESTEQKKNINNIITISKNLNTDEKKCFRQYNLQNNSNMVKVLDYDKEYTPFVSLTKYNDKEKIEISKSIMKCINILHDQYNMYHRYLIPENILIKKIDGNGGNIYKSSLINFKEAIQDDFIDTYYNNDDIKTREEYFKFISSWILNKKIRYLFCGNFYLLLLEYMIYYWISNDSNFYDSIINDGKYNIKFEPVLQNDDSETIYLRIDESHFKTSLEENDRYFFNIIFSNDYLEILENYDKEFEIINTKLNPKKNEIVEVSLYIHYFCLLLKNKKTDQLIERYKKILESSDNFIILQKLLNDMKKIYNVKSESSTDLKTSIEFLKKQKLDYESIYESFRNMKYLQMKKPAELKG